MTPEPVSPPEPWSMGLRGLWAAVGNATALVLICVMFWRAQEWQIRRAAEDHEMWREELRDLTAAMRAVADEVHDLRRERRRQSDKDHQP